MNIFVRLTVKEIVKKWIEEYKKEKRLRGQ